MLEIIKVNFDNTLLDSINKKNISIKQKKKEAIYATRGFKLKFKDNGENILWALSYKVNLISSLGVTYLTNLINDSYYDFYKNSINANTLLVFPILCSGFIMC